MTAAVLAAKEFELYLQHLTENLPTITSLIDADPVNPAELHDLFEELVIDAETLETFRPRPTTSTKNQPYDFTTAIAPLASFKRIRPKVIRVLTRAGVEFAPVKQDEVQELPVARKIPDMVIPPFSGDITLYSAFKSAFKLKYDALPIPNSEKLSHLKSLLSGSPLLLVRNLDLTDDNYTYAMSTLDNEYERPDSVISALYHRLEQLPQAGKLPEEQQQTYYQIEGLLAALKAHHQPVDNMPPLRDKIISKYPLWLARAACKGEIPSITVFQKAIATEIQLAKNLYAATSHRTATRSKADHSSSTTSLVAVASKGNARNNKKERHTPTCLFCSEQHYSAQCMKFPMLAERNPFLKNRCSRCLNANHETVNCTRTISCRFCHEKNTHNSAFCPKQFSGNTTNSQTPFLEPARSVNFAQRSRGALNTVLVPVYHHKTRITHPLRLLMDQGSDDTYISEYAARILGLPLSRFRSIPIQAFGDQHFSMKSAETVFELTNNDGFDLVVQADTTPNTPQNVRLFDYTEFREKFPEYAAMKFVDTGVGHPIDIILGNDYLFDLIKPETKITIQPGLYLIDTEFGYILTGRQVCSNSTKTSTFDNATLLAISPAAAIDRLSSLDVLGISETPLADLKEEENALKQFYANLKFCENRYQIRWPWRSFPPPLSNNFGLALGRLRSQLKKLTTEHFQAYDNIIAQQLDSGIVEEVTDGSQLKNDAYYVPHHPVYTPEKSTPLRIVYDGSAKPAKDMNSVNEAIYKGKNLLVDLTATLLHFRLNPIAMVADLEKCFHQLSINPVDRDYVRFLWVLDPTKPASGRNLRILRFTRVAFGIVASPFLSNAVIQHHLQQYPNEYFTAKDIYVDNLISGAPDVESGQAMYSSGVETFRKCSMNLRNWASSSASVRASFPQYHCDQSSKISVLGIQWNQYKDTLQIKSISSDSGITLRTILSVSSTFYDPCGWFSLLTIKAKLLMQNIREADLKWDDALPPNFIAEWRSVRKDLIAATEFSLPRFHTTLQQYQTYYELHCFADASAKAYACVTYLRTTTAGVHNTFLLFSKARIAPKKANLTIPKLELLAALIGSRAIKFLQAELKIERAYLWLDSKCVIHWILGNKILPTFIQRRVQEIRELSNLEIRYVPTDQNPADAPSRGIEFNEITSLWWNGPAFLLSSTWPPPPSLDQLHESEVSLELPLEGSTVLTTEKIITYPFDLLERFRNSYDTLIRISAIIIRFLRRLKLLPKRDIFDPNRSSREIAKLLWARAEQRNHYPDVIQHLRNGKCHPLIRALRLKLDNDDVLRCSGRFRHAPLSTDEKSPILLPRAKDSFLTRLVIIHYHEQNFHVGTGHTLSSLRRTFWVPSGRAAVYAEIKKCVKCKRYIAQPYRQPSESELPDFRLQKSEVPFTFVGVDTFGHLWISRQKRYVMIVVDLVIRAIDLEPLRTMTANDICLAFRNIVARRSTPKLVISDNAPQLELLRQNLENQYVNVDWKFIPELASWMAGAYERLIAPVKNSLFRTFAHQPLTDALLRTALAEIAAVLNSRPLTYLSSDADDTPLTPNHFLKARFSMSERDTDVNLPKTPTAANLIHLWKRSNQLVENFWSIWRTQYLSYLRERPASANSSQRATVLAPQVDEVVIIAKPNVKRSNWKLGRITELIPSSDGQIRSVSLQTQHGIITRPVHVLYPLEVTDRTQLPLTPSQSNDEIEEEVIEVDLELEF